MPKFIYKMQNILGIKLKMEEQAKTAYGIAKLNLTKEEEKLFALNQKHVLYQLKCKELMSQVLNIIKINQCFEDIEIIKSNITLQKEAVKRAEQKVETARLRLNAAMQERKTHEKLKEKAFDEFVLEYEAEQRKEIDELVSYRYNSPTAS